MEDKKAETEILKILRDLSGSTCDIKAHKEEHRFLRELIEKAKIDKDLKREVVKNLMTQTSWLAMLALGAGLWYLFLEKIKEFII